jgi:hypothetical protein
MGIAKTICAFGTFDFYSSDYKKFVVTLGQLLKVNIEVKFLSNSSDEDFLSDKENEIFDFNFAQTYYLTVTYDEIDRGNSNPDNLYVLYNLYIPLDFSNQNELDLEFGPNGIFFIIFLPFDNHWKFFVEDILGKNDHYYDTHAEIVENIMKIRESYVENLRRINCSEIIIWTDGWFKSEDFLFDNSSDKKYSFDDVVDQISVIDDIVFYNFMEVVGHKVEIESKRHDFLDIAFIDRFEILV